jgi:signal transduction histidine kinase
MLLETNKELRNRTEELERREEELRKAQEQLLQSQKMEAIGRLAGGVAHDFNNLLTAIRGYGDLLLQSLKPEDAEYRFMEEIRAATQRAADLTQQLLAFGRRQILQPQVINFNEIITGLDGILRRLIDEDIELSYKLEPELESVKVDPNRMEQVLMNLVINARDAMPRGGRLTIATSNREIGEAQVEGYQEIKSGQYIMTEVSDTGIGMDKELTNRIFEPFFSTKTKGQGSGMGLATVYGIVRQSGGQVSVHSEPNGGTTFTIILPRVPEPSVPIRREDTENGLGMGTETVLLVEDEENVRRLIRRVLEGKGYTVLSASQASEALSLCSECTLKSGLFSFPDIPTTPFCTTVFTTKESISCRSRFPRQPLPARFGKF